MQFATIQPYERDEAVRVQCTCPFCKHRWIEDGQVHIKRDHRGRRTVDLRTWNGADHRCARIEAKIERELEQLSERRALLGTPGRITEAKFIADIAGCEIRKIILKCSVREDVPCNAKCTGAVGPSCDCSCGGKNHGANTHC